MNEYSKEAEAAISAGLRVDVDMHRGQASATLAIARENARRASEANERCERVLVIFCADGRREFECGVVRDTARRLRELVGATV